MNDHPGLVREIHDHSAGPCTLPDPPYTQANNFGYGGLCYVELDWQVRTCSCDLCSGRSYYRWARRAERAAARTLTRAAALGAPEQTLEVLAGRVDALARSPW